MKNIVTGIIGMAILWVAMSFTKISSGGGKLNLVFTHYVGDELLRFDSVSYKNALGQSFTVTKFKYYIGKIQLRKTGGGVVKLKGYYLINEEEQESKKIAFGNIPDGQYDGMDMIIGVDSIDNCSGAQSGALDPINAMFWAWNTGYIFLKLEGKAPASKSPGNIFEYHIGGYKASSNCIRKVSLKFNETMKVEGKHTSEILIKADAAEVLKTPNTIDLAKMSSVTDFHNATLIADNYSDMLSILAVK